MWKHFVGKKPRVRVRGVFEEVSQMFILYSLAALAVAGAALAGAYSLLKDSFSNDW